MDLLSLVREGRDQELDESLGKVEIKANSHDESEEAAECRKEVFGQTAWSSGMTLLLWAVEASNLEIEKRIALGTSCPLFILVNSPQLQLL